MLLRGVKLKIEYIVSLLSVAGSNVAIPILLEQWKTYVGLFINSRGASDRQMITIASCGRSVLNYLSNYENWDRLMKNNQIKGNIDSLIALARQGVNRLQEL